MSASIEQSSPGNRDPALENRAAALFHVALSELHARTDRLFAILLALEWIAGVGVALWISPLTWAGTSAPLNVHVWTAIFLGAAIVSFPIYLALKWPGLVMTRQVIAVAQMSYSALLIHLMGGQIEAHFHIFGSLAFLAFYRDWRVLATATAVVFVDHVARGLLWPESIFGVLAASPWRVVEHAAWVIFEDIFLLISIRQSRREMLEVTTRQARLEAINTEIEIQVAERTAALTVAQGKLIEASRHAGMAEVATGILHNVGNVLNSVGVSATVVIDQIKRSKISNLSKVGEMLEERSAHLAQFVAEDPVGSKIPAYLNALAAQMIAERQTVVDELQGLQKNIEHIKAVVAMQQGFAGKSGLVETVQLTELVEDALQMNDSSLTRHAVEMVREFDARPVLNTDRHKIMQILINLVRNAILACDDSGRSDKRVVVQIGADHKVARISVRDNGVGIPAENLTQIFGHGFTTRKRGHGFGLHSSALAAAELGGSLAVQSEGRGHGATFVLELPLVRASGGKSPLVLEPAANR